jgi:2'-5' RNA ligase
MDGLMEQIYDTMWKNALGCFQDGRFETDSRIDDPADTRRGITLRFKPSGVVLGAFARFLKKAKTIEPNQYYYEREDIHITVMSLVTCQEGYHIRDSDTAQYVSLIRSCISDLEPFQIKFQGITASPSCVLAQGFVPDEELYRFRAVLRSSFKESSLHHSIDRRYALETAHCTLIRLRTELSDPRRFITLLQEARDRLFGTTLTTELELVDADWYHRHDLVRILETFPVKNTL